MGDAKQAKNGPLETRPTGLADTALIQCQASASVILLEYGELCHAL